MWLREQLQPSLLQPFLLRFPNCFHDFLCRACGLLSSARSCTAEASIFSRFFLDSGRGDAPSQSYPGHRHIPDPSFGHQEEDQPLTNSFSVAFPTSIYNQRTDLVHYESLQRMTWGETSSYSLFLFPLLAVLGLMGTPRRF